MGRKSKSKSTRCQTSCSYSWNKKVSNYRNYNVNFYAIRNLDIVQSMLIDGAKHNVIHFWESLWHANCQICKDRPIFNSKINFDFYFINWWFEAVCCEIDSGITLASLNTQKMSHQNFMQNFIRNPKILFLNFFLKN